MRLLLLIALIVSSACRAADLPRIELVRRDGLEAHLKFVNAGEKDVYLSPYSTIEEFYERPACDDCAKGWIATRPRRLSVGSDLIRVGAGESLTFDSPLSPLRRTRVSVFAAASPSAKKAEFQSVQIEIPAPPRK